MAGPATPGSWDHVSRTRDRLQGGHGGAWSIPQAMPGLRRAGAEDCLRRERDLLLRPLPDWWEVARRPRAVAALEERLAEDAGRVGGVRVADIRDHVA